MLASSLPTMPPKTAIAPPAPCRIVVGSLKVTAFTEVNPIPSARPIVMEPKPFAIAASSVLSSCNVPGPPATPTEMPTALGCNVNAPVPITLHAPPEKVSASAVRVSALEPAATVLPNSIAVALSVVGPASVTLSL